MTHDITNVIQVTNVSPVITKDQLNIFFSHIGKIEDIKLYPELEDIDVSTRVCYVKYRDSEDVSIALHLTNTVFIDKALIVVPVSDDKIPDELTALGMGGSEGVNPSNMYQGLAQYPEMPINTDISKVEEIRRTVYASNINSSLSPDKLMQFFSQAGEIKYMRMAGEENVSIRHAFIEYTDQNSVIKALGLNGHVLEGNQMRITPSNSAIEKPSMMPGISAAAKVVEEAMKKVSEAESMISVAAGILTNDCKRSRSRRSRSRSRSRSRIRSRSRRSRSRRSRSRRSRSRRRSRLRRMSRSGKSRPKRSRSRISRSKKVNSRSRSRKSRSHDRGGRDKNYSRSGRSSREKKTENLDSKTAYDSRVNSTEREGSENSENRSRTSKKSIKKPDFISRRSRSRSRSKKTKKSYDIERDKKSSKDEKDIRKNRHRNR